MVRKGLLRGARGASTATDKEITRAYRKLAKQYHPDANPGAEDRFKEISAAYDVLGDADRRKEYDEVRRLGPWPVASDPRWLRGRRHHQLPVEDLGIWGPLRRIFGGRAADGAPAAPSAVRTWRPSCTSPSKTPCGARRSRSTSRSTPAATPVVGAGGSGDRHAHLRPLWRSRDPRRQPGPLLLSTVCPKCNGRAPLSTRRARPATGPHRAAQPPGEGADPSRRGRRPAIA